MCGSVAAIVVVRDGNIVLGAWLVILAAVFDFFDGFAARLLKVSGDLGKQMDSLADMVTFGLVPGLIGYSVMHNTWAADQSWPEWMNYVPLFITLMSALRLAKFNIDTRQTDQFIGVPTPAITLAWLGIPFFFASSADLSALTNASATALQNDMVLAYIPALAIISGIFLNLPTPLLALKFNNFGWKGNEARFILILLSVIGLVGGYIVFNNPFQPLPIVILLYLIISVITNALTGTNQNA